MLCSLRVTHALLLSSFIFLTVSTALAAPERPNRSTIERPWSTGVIALPEQESTAATNQAVRDYHYLKKEPTLASDTTLTLGELGLLQLAAHDLFDVDRDLEVDRENGKLDLSTLLNHGDEYIALGGESRNRENIFMFSVASDYGTYYLRQLESRTEADAYARTLSRYHRALGKVYKKLFGNNLPKPILGPVTMTENLALRTVHDFLPEEISMGRTIQATINPELLGKKLSSRDLMQPTSPLDGAFDPGFLDVVVIIPPDDVRHIDLFERDSSFGAQFETDFTFEYFMHELADGSYDRADQVTQHIERLFAKGLYLE